MKFAATLFAALSLVSAVPVDKRDNSGGPGDVAILQYALTLENLEATFYAQGLSQYDESAFASAGFPSSARERITEIGSHEKTHVAFLSTALKGLGQTPTAACKYNFGYTDVKSFLATAAILEGVGVSAYLGAAQYIMNKLYLTAAASIYGIEARHASYIRDITGEDPFPSAFETPLDFDEVYSLASAFIVSCPSSNPTLPVKAFPALTATAVGGKAVPKGMVKLTPAKPLTAKGPLYAAFVGLTGTQFGAYNTQTETVEISYLAAGQTYIVLTTSDKMVTDDNIVAGPAILEVVVN